MGTVSYPEFDVGQAVIGEGEFGDGSAASPSITFENDTDTGIFRNGSDQLSIATGGAEVVRADQSQNFDVRGNSVLMRGGNIQMVGSSTDAAGGAIRMGNNVDIRGRNAADDGDIILVRTDGSDVVGLGGANSTRVETVNADFGVDGNNVIEVGGTTDASTGAVRLANNVEVAWRNAANSADVALEVDGNDNIVLGSTGSPDVLVSGGAMNLRGGNLVEVGGQTDASTGDIRLSNGSSARWRNSGDAADISGVSVTGGDVIVLGALGNGSSVRVGGTINLGLNGNDIIEVGSTTDASAGGIRLGNNEDISWRNSGDTADISVRVTGGDKVTLSPAGNAAAIRLPVSPVEVNGGDLTELGGTTDASAGAVRLATASEIRWRNAGDTDDSAIAVDGNDDFVFQTVAGTTDARLAATVLELNGLPITGVGSTTDASAGAIRLGESSVINWRDTGQATDRGLQLNTGINSIAVNNASFSLEGNTLRQVGGTTAAAAGAIRLANDVLVAARNNANSADINVFKVNTSDEVEIPSTVRFSGITGTPTMAGHDHSEGGMTAVGAVAVQTITPTEVDGSGGTDGQAMVTDGSAGGVSWSDVGGVNEIPWTEDANSPFTGSGAQTQTFTLASSYDIVMVVLDHITNDHTSNNTIGLRIDGDSGSNYNFQNTDGTVTTNGSKWNLIVSLGVDDEVFGTFMLDGAWAENAKVVANIAGSSVQNNPLVQGINDNVVSPLDSITVTGAQGNFTVRARVYGASI